MARSAVVRVAGGKLVSPRDTRTTASTAVAGRAGPEDHAAHARLPDCARERVVDRGGEHDEPRRGARPRRARRARRRRRARAAPRRRRRPSGGERRTQSSSARWLSWHPTTCSSWSRSTRASASAMSSPGRASATVVGGSGGVAWAGSIPLWIHICRRLSAEPARVRQAPRSPPSTSFRSERARRAPTTRLREVRAALGEVRAQRLRPLALEVGEQLRRAARPCGRATSSA